MINKVFLVGNLTKDPEIKSIGGTSVLTFSIAVNDRRKDGDEWKDVPNFFGCSMFGVRAERLSAFLAKGMKVAIEGKLRWHQWETEQGKRSKVDIVVSDVEIMVRKQAEDKPETVTFNGSEITFYEDDIPF